MAGDKNYTAARPNGTVLIFGPTGLKEFDTRRCVHCQAHFPVSPGSGKIRGFCQRCMGPICGPDCLVCVHWERALELNERGVIPDLSPASIAVVADRLPTSILIPAGVPAG